MKTLTLTLMLLLVASCASYNPGKYADVVQGEHPEDFPINAEVVNNYSEDNYTFVNFTFGNLSNDWRRIKKIRVLSIGGNEKSRIIIGQDLRYWAEGMERKIKIDRHNSQVMWGSISGALLVGAGVASYNNNKNLTIGLAGGAIAAASVNDVNYVIDKLDALEMANLVPNSHLYMPFSIPPNLFLARWVLFESPDGDKPNFIEFEIEFLSGQKASYVVNL